MIYVVVLGQIKTVGEGQMKTGRLIHLRECAKSMYTTELVGEAQKQIF